MKRFTLYFLLIFGIQYIYSQTDLSEEQYIKLSKKFLESIKLQDSLYIFEDSYKFPEDCLVDLRNDFTTEEIRYIKEKNDAPDIKKWSSKILNNKSKITKKERWVYCLYSSPIFIRNDTYCLFYFEEHCGDGVCGDVGLTLYKKSNKKWTNIRTYCGWKYIEPE